jgi:hypothetical protein
MAHALPLPSPYTPPLANRHERRFREIEIALFHLIVELRTTDRDVQLALMQAAERLVTEFRAQVLVLAPGRLGS